VNLNLKPDTLARAKSRGFRLVKKRSVWDTKPDKTRQSEMPAYNAIFARGST